MKKDKNPPKQVTHCPVCGEQLLGLLTFSNNEFLCDMCGACRMDINNDEKSN